MAALHVSLLQYVLHTCNCVVAAMQLARGLWDFNFNFIFCRNGAMVVAY